MIGLPPSTRVWLVAGVTDMRNYAECGTMLRLRDPAPSRAHDFKALARFGRIGRFA
jgi:hypothetical protein